MVAPVSDIKKLIVDLRNSSLMVCSFEYNYDIKQYVHNRKCQSDLMPQIYHFLMFYIFQYQEQKLKRLASPKISVQGLEGRSDNGPRSGDGWGGERSKISVSGN